jgi:hypothetical protein
VGGLVAFGVYKFSTRDAQRIEEHTGVEPEELDDAEIEQAMRDLNIDPQTVTSEDLEQGGAPTGVAPAASADYLDEIERLAALHEQGILTDATFGEEAAHAGPRLTIPASGWRHAEAVVREKRTCSRSSLGRLWQ